MGYQFALQDNEIPFQEIGPWNFQFLIHVSRRTDKQPVSSRGYHTMILPHVGGDEAKALDLFWQLLDEFREQEAAKEPQINP